MMPLELRKALNWITTITFFISILIWFYKTPDFFGLTGQVLFFFLLAPSVLIIDSVICKISKTATEYVKRDVSYNATRITTTYEAIEHKGEDAVNLANGRLILPSIAMFLIILSYILGNYVFTG